MLLWFYFPKRHPFLVALLLCIFANERAFKESLEAEKEIGLIFDGRHDNSTQTYVLARKAIGQKLIAKHCSFGVGNSQLFHGTLKGFAAWLSAIGVSNQPKQLVKTLHARCVIVRDECGANPAFFEVCKPIQNFLVRIGFFVGGECIVNINQECAHANRLQKCGCDLVKGGKQPQNASPDNSKLQYFDKKTYCFAKKGLLFCKKGV